MKTTVTVSALLIMLAINISAQVKTRGQQPVNLPPRNEPKNNPKPAVQNNNAQGDHWGYGGWNGNISIGFGSPYYGNPYPYNYYYGNGYSVKKVSRNSIRAASHVINQAVAFDSWHDIYSPLLAKAIRHYNYARHLYWWGNYEGAYNHAERARYLAWYSSQCFQDPGYYYNGGAGPNPYSDPYNPYYRKGQSSSNGASEKNDNGLREKGPPKNEAIDSKLPGSNVDDKELIRSFDKSELKDE